jgi:hypothetical protein
MADSKISALTTAGTLAGTEVLPIVQSSTTKKVAVDDLTVKNVRSNATTGVLQIAGPAAAATRTMTVPDANFTAARTDAAQTFTGVQTMTSPKVGTSIDDTNGNELLKLTATASAVNELTLANAATSGSPTLSATGNDTNISITITPKGTGVLRTAGITTTLGNITVNGAASGTTLSVNSNLSATTGVQTVASFLGVTSGSTDSAYAAAILAYTKNLNGNYWPAAFGAANYSGGSNYADAVIYWGNTGTALVEGIRLQAVSGDVQVKTGNLVISTSGKGIDFSATSQATGMTSELLADYEEGTWTPSQGAGLTVVGAFSSAGRYTKIGRLVTLSGYVQGGTSVAVSTGNALTSNLPFTVGANGVGVMIANNQSLGGQLVAAGTDIYTTGMTAVVAIYFTVTYSV